MHSVSQCSYRCPREAAGRSADADHSRRTRGSKGGRDVQGAGGARCGNLGRRGRDEHRCPTITSEITTAQIHDIMGSPSAARVAADRSIAGPRMSTRDNGWVPRIRSGDAPVNAPFRHTEHEMCPVGSSIGGPRSGRTGVRAPGGAADRRLRRDQEGGQQHGRTHGVPGVGEFSARDSELSVASVEGEWFVAFGWGGRLRREDGEVGGACLGGEAGATEVRSGTTTLRRRWSSRSGLFRSPSRSPRHSYPRRGRPPKPASVRRSCRPTRRRCRWRRRARRSGRR